MTANKNSFNDSLEAFNSLSEAARSLYVQMREKSDLMLSVVKLSDPEKSVLKTITQYGSRSVPQIAKLSGFTRQHILATVNELIKENLVRLKENPFHKTSHLVEITEKGKNKLEKLQKIESKILKEVKLNVKTKDIRFATHVMDEVMDAFSQSSFTELLKKIK